MTKACYFAHFLYISGAPSNFVREAKSCKNARNFISQPVHHLKLPVAERSEQDVVRLLFGYTSYLR
jgi:hypothetical protein